MKKLHTKQWIAVVVALCVVGFFFIFGQVFMSIFNNQFNTSAMLQSHLGIQDVLVGTGDEALPGTLVTVQYVGTLPNGQVFDSSVSRNEPFQFTLGAGQVIEGWDKGIVGMKVGGKRILTIPPEMAYGMKAYGPIPGNSTLVFQVELLNVSK